MFRHRRTLVRMDRAALIAYTADLVLEHGGDDEAIFAVLRNQLRGEDLDQGEILTCCALYALEEFGADALRQVRDRRRGIIPTQPVPSGAWRGWGAADVRR